MVKCLVCGTKFEGLSCPVCKIERPACMGRPGKEEINELRKKIVSHKKHILDQVVVTIPIFRYQKLILHKEGKYLFERPEMYECSLHLSKLVDQDLYWNREFYLYQKGELELEFMISGKGGKQKCFSEKLSDPCVETAYVKFGLMLLPGLKFRLLYGNEQAYSQSGEYSILDLFESCMEPERFVEGFDSWDDM